MMKLQDVLLKAMGKKDHVVGGGRDRRSDGSDDAPLAGTIGGRRVFRAVFRETYFDLKMRHFHEKLREEHGIELSYTWLRKALQGAGLVARYKKRGKHRHRERRAMTGMLLHIDGSKHQWFGDERWHDPIVMLDDASSEIYYAPLVEEESTRTVMAGVRPSLLKARN